MTREIKFRSWDKEGNEMLVWEKLVKNNTELVDLEISLEKFVFMQFIGLLDKNGKEIYEGDLVKSGQYGVVEIQYVHSSFCGVDNKGNIRRINFGNTWEIIGNIYTSPHLLTSEVN